MKQASSTKRALFTSALAVLVCVAMLVGTTFAWFTDSASTGVNRIMAGNLDVALSYKNAKTDKEFVLADENTKVFDEEALWEPGHVEYAVLKVSNEGTLALKYKLGVNIASETGSTNVNDKAFKLSEYIRFAVLEGDATTAESFERADLVAAAGEGATLNTGYSPDEGHLAAKSMDHAEDTVTLVVWMPTTVGNEANHKTGADAPSINLGISVYAMQDTVESDSFGNDYDKDADMTPDNLDVVTVDGIACDSLTSAVEKASEGSVITLHKSTTEPLKLENTEPITIKGVTFKSDSDVTIKGLQLSTEKTDNKVTLEDVTFDGISFTDRVVLGQSKGTNGASQCSNITFVNCKFDMSASAEKYKDVIWHGTVTVTGDITEEKEANAYLDGLTVKNCEFKNMRYAIRGGKIRNVTVEGCRFVDLTDYAISLADAAGTVVISGNTADNTKGVLEINTVGNNYSTKQTEIKVTIKDNTATNMTCDNGLVFYTTFDNARASGKSTYTITGNSCTYTKTFDEPLNGFKIRSTYGPSKTEFIENQ